ncbi:hypothetical protein [Microbispora triticiradicis]|uniref:hypothetical protein n=1 Tax=Microbispora triticiradicis TaxID=2200763 RepID=UPI001AD6F1B6|nr:hypothetical protein [Microbispora triticiradicis]MBO4271847.1 hypothetical protein [Microbispora triticiradicis]
MGAQHLGRRALRTLTRRAGRPVVFANTYGLITTTEHVHPSIADAGDLDPHTIWGPCRERFSSCATIFGTDEQGRAVHFMRGGCRDCTAGPGEIHRARCPRLARLLALIPAGYWPVPVHEPTFRERQSARRAAGVTR